MVTQQPFQMATWKKFITTEYKKVDQPKKHHRIAKTK